MVYYNLSRSHGMGMEYSGCTRHSFLVINQDTSNGCYLPRFQGFVSYCVQFKFSSWCTAIAHAFQKTFVALFRTLCYFRIRRHKKGEAIQRCNICRGNSKRMKGTRLSNTVASIRNYETIRRTKIVEKFLRLINIVKDSTSAKKIFIFIYAFDELDHCCFSSMVLSMVISSSSSGTSLSKLSKLRNTLTKVKVLIQA